MDWFFADPAPIAARGCFREPASVGGDVLVAPWVDLMALLSEEGRRAGALGCSLLGRGTRGGSEGRHSPLGESGREALTHRGSGRGAKRPGEEAKMGECRRGPCFKGSPRTGSRSGVTDRPFIESGSGVPVPGQFGPTYSCAAMPRRRRRGQPEPEPSLACADKALCRHERPAVLDLSRRGVVDPDEVRSRREPWKLAEPREVRRLRLGRDGPCPPIGVDGPARELGASKDPREVLRLRVGPPDIRDASDAPSPVDPTAAAEATRRPSALRRERPFAPRPPSPHHIPGEDATVRCLSDAGGAAHPRRELGVATARPAAEAARPTAASVAGAAEGLAEVGATTGAPGWGAGRERADTGCLPPRRQSRRQRHSCRGRLAGLLADRGIRWTPERRSAGTPRRSARFRRPPTAYRRPPRGPISLPTNLPVPRSTQHPAKKGPRSELWSRPPALGAFQFDGQRITAQLSTGPKGRETSRNKARPPVGGGRGAMTRRAGG